MRAERSVSLDITGTTEPRSDQMNFDDFVSGPKTVTVAEVKKGSAEQPVEVHLVEFPGRPFKPAKSMRRVLIAAWGADAAVYKGRRITLYGDPEVKFGGQAVGGIRISHLSHIPGPLEVKLTVTRGKRAPFIVQPIREKDTSGRDWLKELAELDGDLTKIEKLGVEAKTANAQAAILNVLRKAHKEALGARTSHRGEVGDGASTTNDPTPPGSIDPAHPDYVAEGDR